MIPYNITPKIITFTTYEGKGYTLHVEDQEGCKLPTEHYRRYTGHTAYMSEAFIEVIEYFHGFSESPSSTVVTFYQKDPKRPRNFTQVHVDELEWR